MQLGTLKYVYIISFINYAGINETKQFLLKKNPKKP